MTKKKNKAKMSRPPIFRMQHIDQMIRQGKYPNCSTIAKHFELKDRKTIQTDINYMRDMLEAPIAFDSQKNGYYYTSENYYLPTFFLSEEDLWALVLAQKIINEYQNMSFYGTKIDTVVQKIVNFLPENEILEAVQDNFSFVERPTTPICYKYLEQLKMASKEHQRIFMKYYAAYNDTYSEREFDPYHVLLHHGNWYAIGYCCLRREIRNFHVARIRDMHITSTKFKAIDNFSLKEYLQESFDLERGDIYTVELLFSAYQSRWIRERIWHPTQETYQREDGSLYFKMKVRGLNDVKRWVLKYGSEVEVVNPPELKQMIINEITKMNSLYTERKI